jgi:hypothetical protein
MSFNVGNTLSGRRRNRRNDVVLPAAIDNQVWLSQVSEYWSRNAVQFFYNGDATFCMVSCMGDMPLYAEFWGNLLGLTGNGYIGPMASF